MRRLFFTFLFTAAFTIGPTLAFAVDFKATIKNIDGTPVWADPNKVGGDPLTLAKVCEDAMVAQIPGDTPTPAEKSQRFWIAVKIHEGKQELNVDEIAVLKKVIGLAYGPLVVGRAYELLDPASVPK